MTNLRISLARLGQTWVLCWWIIPKRLYQGLASGSGPQTLSPCFLLLSQNMSNVFLFFDNFLIIVSAVLLVKSKSRELVIVLILAEAQGRLHLLITPVKNKD